MIVICTNDSWGMQGNRSFLPIKDKIYTAIEATIFDGVVAYRLKEIPFMVNGNIAWWDSKGFTSIDNYMDNELEEELSELNLDRAK